MKREFLKFCALAAVLTMVFVACFAYAENSEDGYTEQTDEFVVENSTTSEPVYTEGPEVTISAEPTENMNAMETYEPDDTVPADTAEPEPTPDPDYEDSKGYFEDQLPMDNEQQVLFGYAQLKNGVSLWDDSGCNTRLGVIENDSFVWVCESDADSTISKVIFDTDVTSCTSEYHTAYVMTEHLVWLGDAYNDAFIQVLAGQEARFSNGIWIPVAEVIYSEIPEVTMEPTEEPDIEVTETMKTTIEQEATVEAEVTVEAEATVEAEVTVEAEATAEPMPTLESETTIEPIPTIDPEMTIEPSDGAVHEMSDEDMRAGLDKTHPDRQIYICSECNDDTFAVGSIVTLEAIIIGYDGLDYSIIWEVDCGDGWQNAGADGLDIISVEITEENLEWNWRVGISMPYAETKE